MTLFCQNCNEITLLFDEFYFIVGSILCMSYAHECCHCSTGLWKTELLSWMFPSENNGLCFKQFITSHPLNKNLQKFRHGSNSVCLQDLFSVFFSSKVTVKTHFSCWREHFSCSNHRYLGTTGRHYICRTPRKIITLLFLCILYWIDNYN